MPPMGAGFLTGQVKNPGDKTMASVSLQSWLTLNCKLSGRTKSGSALTVGLSESTMFREGAPYGGSFLSAR